MTLERSILKIISIKVSIETYETRFVSIRIFAYCIKRSKHESNFVSDSLRNYCRDESNDWLRIYEGKFSVSKIFPGADTFDGLILKTIIIHSRYICSF